MNKTLLAPFFFITVFLFSCRGEVEEFRIIDITFYYVNETSDTVTISGFCGFDEFKNLKNQLVGIPSGDTLILHQQDREYTIPPNPSVDNITLYTGGSCKAMYSDKRCSGILDGFGNILYYENRKEVAPLVFEFTFRFTEEKRAEAEPCL